MFKNSNSKAIVPSRGAAVTTAKPGPSAVSIVTPEAIPETVKKGLMGLIVGFVPPGMGGMSDEDRAIYLDGYKMAVDGFELAVVEYVTKHLRLHNPRNTEKFTQPPTAQDVHETCKRVRSQWKERCLGYFTGIGSHGADFTWGKLSYSRYLDRTHKPMPWGPEPLQPGCFIPDDLVVMFLREGLGNGARGNGLRTMDESRFNRIPAEAFDAGVRETLIAEREERARQKAEAARLRDQSQVEMHAKWAAEDKARLEAEIKRQEEKFGYSNPWHAEERLRSGAEHRQKQRSEVLGNLLQPMDDGDQMEADDDGKAYY
jgi:hypothetical protein